jgi:hypothetical protein
VVVIVVLALLLTVAVFKVASGLKVVNVVVNVVVIDASCEEKGLEIGVAPTGAQYPRTQTTMACVLVCSASTGSFESEEYFSLRSIAAV